MALALLPPAAITRDDVNGMDDDVAGMDDANEVDEDNGKPGSCGERVQAPLALFARGGPA